MDYLVYFSQIFSSISGLGFIVGIVILYKMGLLEFLLNLKKNGNGNGKKDFDEIKTRIESLSTNHLHTLEEMIRDIKENNHEMRRVLEEHSRDEIQRLDKILIYLEKR